MKKKSKGYAKGGMMKAKGMKAGGKMPMVKKGGAMVPAFAADGKGKMQKGGQIRMSSKMMANGGMTAVRKKEGGNTVARGSGAARSQKFTKNGQMAIDRPLATPDTIFSEGQGDEPDLEIEILNPEAVSIETEDGGMVIDFDPDFTPEGAVSHDANLAEYIDDSDLQGIASDLLGSFKSDKESRADWSAEAPMSTIFARLKNR